MKQIRVRGTVVLGLGVVLCAWPVWAQQSGTAPPSGAGAAPTTTPSPSPSTPTPSPTPTRPTPSPFPDTRQPSTTNQDTRPTQESSQPIFLSGKVVLEDGTPPPESVVIQRICGAVVRPEGYTDSKGRFSFQLGQNNSIIPDASIGSGLGFPGMGGQGNSMGGFNSSGGFNTRDLAGCGLRASLPGFRSDEIPLNGIRPMDRPDVGTIVLHRYGNVEGTTISMTSLQAPKEAKKAFENGRKAMAKKKWPEARLQFEKAVELYPQYAAAWCDLGRAQEEAGNTAEARKAYAQALTTDARFVTPYIQLAGIAVKEGNWRETADTTSRIVKLNPGDFPGMYFLNAVANYNLKEFTAAEQSAREALKLDTQHRFPQANQILGVVLARKGEFTEAAAYMKTYLQLAPEASNVDLVKKQLAEVERSAQAGAGFPR